ncbi:MAG: ABC transporter substrate-binding protein [Acidimicrobiales bacterium]|nr:ABC transporter substrate-binding protein [Acidimicrobiales bacterium]
MLSLLAGALLVATLAGCGSDAGSDGSGTSSKGADATSATDDPIVIGLVDEKTGPTAAVQGAAGDGVRLAVETINDAGGIGGRQIELLERDSAGEAATAISGINEMVDEGAVAIVGPVNGGLCQAVAPTYAELEVPGFCLSPVDLPKETSYMYGIGVELAQEDEILFDQLGAQNGTFGIIAQKTPVLDLVKSHVERFAGDADVKIEAVETTDTSARTQIERLIGEGIGGLLLAPCGPLSVTAAKEAIDLGFEGPIVVWNCFASAGAAKQMAPITNGNIYTVAPTFILGDATDDDPQKAAIDAYEAAGGPADIVAAAGWDGMQALAGAIEEGGATSKEIQDTLEGGYSYIGVWSMGEISAHDHRGVSTDGALRLVRFTPEGTMEPVDSL